MLLNCIVLYRILLFYNLGKTLNHSDQSCICSLFKLAYGHIEHCHGQ